jgi:hypothetical protein
VLLIEKRREYNLETHVLFIDYEKSFDSVPRHTVFDILISRNIPDALLKAIMDIHTQNNNKIKFQIIKTS